MTKVLLIASVLLASVHPTALAGGVNLSWDDCGTAGTLIKHFACDRNTGADILVSSFVPNSDLAQVIGVEAVVDVVFRAGVVPGWWQFRNEDSCRATRLIVLGLPSPQQTGCADPWQGQIESAAVSYAPAFEGDPRRARITASRRVSLTSAASVQSGTEYYALQLLVLRGRSVGTDACSGCDEPALLIAARTRLIQLDGGYADITSPSERNFVCWQCDCGIGEWDIFFGFCPVTPISNRTWGAVKGLYR